LFAALVTPGLNRKSSDLKEAPPTSWDNLLMPPSVLAGVIDAASANLSPLAKLIISHNFSVSFLLF
jgi:hypothetical protein